MLDDLELAVPNFGGSYIGADNTERTCFNLPKPEACLMAMSSREIAELTGKDHKNVMADIRNMLDGLDITSPEFSGDLPDSYGRMQPCFNLPKRENCLMAMSSREIAELTGKRHDNVMADIRGMFNELEIHSPEFSGQYKDSTGRTLPCFNLPKRETLILVSGYSVALRAKIVDRWQGFSVCTKMHL